uniref:B30.2/SPRY domain-containing protein n=1 Tax=Cyprinus carpio TaxID=7962 RepID=A0A8C2BYL8_CYPCA
IKCISTLQTFCRLKVKLQGLQKCGFFVWHTLAHFMKTNKIIQLFLSLSGLDFCDLTLDPNTASTQLILSENGEVKYVDEQQPYPDHPDRFKDIPQVLCRESLTGRHYWEVERTGWARVAVAYKTLSRKEGMICKFGYNYKSWCLFCTINGFTVWHNNESNNIPAPSPSSKRVGVYLDWPAGTLSFYSVSDTHTLTHLHTFNTTFTEPLYAGFKVFNSSLSLTSFSRCTIPAVCSL